MTMSVRSIDYYSPSSFNKQDNFGTMVEQEDDDEFMAKYSSDDDVLGVVSDDEEEDSDLFDQVNSSSGSTSPTSPFSGSSSKSSSSEQLANEPLQDMSALLQELPFKKGLSKHYNGKSQSFTSLAKAICLEDLAKPENPYNKRLQLKSCKSYGLLDSYRSSQPHRSASSSRLISKKTPSSSRSSGASLLSSSIKRNVSFLGNRPPPTSSTSFANQAPLFA